VAGADLANGSYTVAEEDVDEQCKFNVTGNLGSVQVVLDSSCHGGLSGNWWPWSTTTYYNYAIRTNGDTFARPYGNIDRQTIGLIIGVCPFGPRDPCLEGSFGVLQSRPLTWHFYYDWCDGSLWFANLKPSASFGVQQMTEARQHPLWRPSSHSVVVEWVE
jgi:hypothetical protein